MPAIKLYGFPLSGHSHRVELMLSLLGLPMEFILVDRAEILEASTMIILLMTGLPGNITAFG